MVIQFKEEKEMKIPSTYLSLVLQTGCLRAITSEPHIIGSSTQQIRCGARGSVSVDPPSLENYIDLRGNVLREPHCTTTEVVISELSDTDPIPLC